MLASQGLEPLPQSYEFNPIKQRPFNVGKSIVQLAETADFQIDDPWSDLTRGVIYNLSKAGQFDGQDFFEAGIGDARNPIAAGLHKPGQESKIIGVDYDPWRVNLAAYNLNEAGIPPDRYSLHEGDVVEWLENRTKPLSGWAIACLPQVPRKAAENDADGFPDLKTLKQFRNMRLNGKKTADDYALTLNTAYLQRLKEVADPNNLDALLTLSDRVPIDVLTKMFSKTGWKIAKVVRAVAPVQQDPDTGIAWIKSFDDGKRFWEKSDEDQFNPITAEEAEQRRIKSLEHGDEARKNLNVFHGLSVFHVKPM